MWCNEELICVVVSQATVNQRHMQICMFNIV